MTEPQGEQPQPQQVQIQPWSWEFPVVGETPHGKLMLIVIQRPLGEVITLPGVVADMKRFHQALGDKIKEHDSGIIVARGTVPWPPNGHR